jgi:hypothetical protein
MGSLPARTLVTISHASLTDPSSDLSAAIEAAFGPEGLGIIVVDGVPGYGDARAKLLPLASRLAALPPGVLAEMEDPASHWNFGWSHGKEKLEGDRVGARARKPLHPQRAASALTPVGLSRVLRVHVRAAARACSRALRVCVAAQTPPRGRFTPTRCWTRPRTTRCSCRGACSLFAFVA